MTTNTTTLHTRVFEINDMLRNTVLQDQHVTDIDEHSTCKRQLPQQLEKPLLELSPMTTLLLIYSFQLWSAF